MHDYEYFCFEREPIIFCRINGFGPEFMKCIRLQTYEGNQ